MAQGYTLDKASIKAIDDVVRRTMSMEPVHRQRRRPGKPGGTRATLAILGVTVEDIPPAYRKKISDLNGAAQNQIKNTKGAQQGDDTKVWVLGRGKVQHVEIVEIDLTAEEEATGLHSGDFILSELGQTEWSSPSSQVQGGAGGSLISRVGVGPVWSGNDPRTRVWYNTCPSTIHAGKLCQGKEIDTRFGKITILDVEPCD